MFIVIRPSPPPIRVRDVISRVNRTCGYDVHKVTIVAHHPLSRQFDGIAAFLHSRDWVVRSPDLTSGKEVQEIPQSLKRCRIQKELRELERVVSGNLSEKTICIPFKYLLRRSGFAIDRLLSVQHGFPGNSGIINPTLPFSRTFLSLVLLSVLF